MAHRHIEWKKLPWIVAVFMLFFGLPMGTQKTVLFCSLLALMAPVYGMIIGAL